MVKRAIEDMMARSAAEPSETVIEMKIISGKERYTLIVCTVGQIAEEGDNINDWQSNKSQGDHF